MNIVSNPKYTSLIKDLHSFQRKLINPQKAVFCLVMTFQCKSLKQKRYIFTLVKLPPTHTLFTGTQTPYQNEHCFYILLYILLYTIVHFTYTIVQFINIPLVGTDISVCDGGNRGPRGNSPIRPWCQHDHLTYRHPYHITTYIVFKIIRLILILHSITCKTTQFIISEN